MKISEMDTEQLCKFIARASTPAANITGDLEVSRAVVEFGKSVPKGTPVLLAISKAVDLFVPKLMKDHADDVYQIVAALTDKPVSEIKKQNGLKTIKEVKDCFDSELVSFFTSSVKREP